MNYIFILVILGIPIAFCSFAFYKIGCAHQDQFKRADYNDHSQSSSLSYADFSSCYPREVIRIPVEQHVLNGFLYGLKNEKGLIIFSSGHRNSTEAYLQSMKYFVDHGWMVICYDYTGYYNSEGKDMIDYTQSVRDLNAVLSYVENSDRFNKIPLLLYGHSLGAYVSTAALSFHHNISAVVAASGFDKPTEQWAYSVKRFTGKLGAVLGPMAALYLRAAYGKDTVRFSAVAGINSTNIPILVISGTDDVYYGGKSPIYIKKDKVTNSNCRFMLMDREGHNGHYDYMLTDQALEYQNLCRSSNIRPMDKWFVMEQDDSFFDQINIFFMSTVQSQKQV